MATSRARWEARERPVQGLTPALVLIDEIALFEVPDE